MEGISASDAAIEKEIQEKGLNAPRLNPERILSTISTEHFWRVPGTPMTVCALILRNGFVVTGESAPVSNLNFNEELGRKIAREKAVDKIWALEGYLMREGMWRAAANVAG